MSHALILECFDPDTVSEPTHPEYQRGYAAALAAARIEFAQAQSSSRDEVSQALQTARFSYVEARAALIQQLSPVFDAISTRLLPQLGHAALIIHVYDAMAQAAANAMSETPTFTMHPDMLLAISAIIDADELEQVKLIADPEQGPLVMWVDSKPQPKMIDMSAAIAEIAAALAALSPPKTAHQQRTVNNG